MPVHRVAAGPFCVVLSLCVPRFPLFCDCSVQALGAPDGGTGQWAAYCDAVSPDGALDLNPPRLHLYREARVVLL